MRRPFTCVYREIWDDKKFNCMSVDGQLVYLYLITCPLGNGIGCFKAGMAALEEDFRAGPKPFAKGLQEVFDNGLAKYDNEARVIFIPSYLFRNPPSNPNGIKALSKEYTRIPDCELKLECYHLVESFVVTKSEGFHEPFYELFDKPLLELLSQQPGIGIGNGIGNSISNCEKKPSEKKLAKTYLDRKAITFISQDIWNEWVDHKSKLKCSISDRSLKMNVDTLSKLGELRADELLSIAMERGWKSIYDPDKGYTGATVSRPTKEEKIEQMRDVDYRQKPQSQWTAEDWLKWRSE